MSSASERTLFTFVPASTSTSKSVTVGPGPRAGGGEGGGAVRAVPPRRAHDRGFVLFELLLILFELVLEPTVVLGRFVLVVTDVHDDRRSTGRAHRRLALGQVDDLVLARQERAGALPHRRERRAGEDQQAQDRRAGAHDRRADRGDRLRERPREGRAHQPRG